MHSIQKAKKFSYSRHLIENSFSLKCLPFPHQSTPVQLQKTMIYIPIEQSENEVKQYEWRCKTEFPIIKIDNFKVTKPTRHMILVEVQMNKYRINLNHLNNLPLFKALYLLKEAIIAYQRLFHKYGPFVITASMIAVDHQGACKVWIAEDYASNRCVRSDMSQQVFLLSIYQLFEERSNQFKATKNFFTSLRQIKTFYSAITFIDSYSKSNKITIPLCLKFNNKKMSDKNQKTEIRSFRNLSYPPKFVTSPFLTNTIKYYPKRPIQASLIEKSQKSTAEITDKTQTQCHTQNSLNLLSKNQVCQQLLVHSYLQPASQKINERKFSEQSPQIRIINPQKNIIKNIRGLVNAKWNENSFVGCEYQQQAKEGEWQCFNSLFDRVKQLKESVHNGKQDWRMSFGNKLEYLGQYGKQIDQSFIKQ